MGSPWGWAASAGDTAAGIDLISRTACAGAARDRRGSTGAEIVDGRRTAPDQRGAWS